VGNIDAGARVSLLPDRSKGVLMNRQATTQPGRRR
jgi:hypothetical protein